MSAFKEKISSRRSVSLTILKAIERAFDLSRNNHAIDANDDTLCIHFLGAEALEIENFMNYDALSVSYTELFDGIQKMGIRNLRMSFIGPNLSCKETSLNKTRLTYSILKIQIECHSCLYHEYYYETIDSGVFEVPDVLLMFNAGIWGYNSWLPTLDIFAILCTISSIQQNCIEAGKDFPAENIITEKNSCTTSPDSGEDDNNDIVAINNRCIFYAIDNKIDNNIIGNVSIGCDDSSSSRGGGSNSSSSNGPLFIVTSYTLEEAEDDEDTIRAHYSGRLDDSSSSCRLTKLDYPSLSNDIDGAFNNNTSKSMQPHWFWEAEINPYSSTQLIERETKVSGREYYANHAWQCFELRPSKE